MSGILEGQQILREISTKKKRLIEVAEHTGLQSFETIKCSQELDEMINSFYRSLQLQHYNRKNS